MATSPEIVRLASNASRPLTEAVFDAVREAVLVVDTRRKQMPVVLANAVARRCLRSDADAEPLVESSLYSLLGSATDAVVAEALGNTGAANQNSSRTLNWRLPRGDVPILTELKLLAPTPGQQLIMFTFAEPVFEASGTGSDVAVALAIEQAPMDLLILDKELTVTYANAGAARTAGNTAGGVLGYSALILTPTSAIPREDFVAALEGHAYHEAVAVKSPGSPTRWFDIDLQPLQGDDTDVVGLAVLSTEVNEPHVQARTVLTSERRLLALTEHARDIISISGPDGKLHYVSGGVRNSLGYTPEERRSNSIFDHVHPDDVDVLKARYAELVDGSEHAFSHQYRVRHRDGSYRWLETSYVSALDSPLINGVVINARDITERRQAEHNLAQREEVFRLAADAVNGVIFEWDLALGVVNRSRGVQDVLGLDPREVRSVSAWSERIHSQDLPGYEEQIAAALKTGRGWTATYRIRNTRGRYRSILERGLIQRNVVGDATRAIGCCVDVTEIKQLTDVLAETQRTAKMGGWEYSYATRELEWTDGMYRIYDTNPKDFTVSWHSMIGQCPPESRQRLDEAIEQAQSTDGTMDVELEIITLKQDRIWVRLVGHLEKADGRPFRAFGSMQNIQVQKAAQIALENSTDWLKLSMNMAHMHAWRWDRATDTLEFAMVDGQMVHLPRVFPGMKKLMSRVHRRDRNAVRSAIELAFDKHSDVHHEFRLLSHDGQYRAYAAVARPLFDAANQPSGLVGVTQDVTARYESEARLRRSEELLRTTTANTADTLLLIDTELRVRFINRGVCGLEIEDILGEEITVILPELARTRVVAKLRHVLATGEPATYEFELRANGAETEYFENRAVLVRDDGSDAGISITVRNITERKRLEQEILDVSSRERQTIGRDLHDGLGQELTGVALMLRGLAARVQKQAPDSMEQVNEIVALVNQSIDTARALARGLLPVNKDGGGLTGALKALVERSRDVYGFDADFQAFVGDDLPFNESTASHLYRIAQEALTNIARHARASSVTVVLTVTKGRFLLRISDDGVGLRETPSARSGMGLKIMQYRAGMIGASFEVMAQVPSGTMVCVTGPRSMATSDADAVPAI